MDGNQREYNYKASSDRIAKILAQPSTAFESVDKLPDRDSLTFENGFYGKCAAVFVDIRDSSGLADSYDHAILAKIYRAFISEMVAVLNSSPTVREVNIVGDCAWAVYTTPKKRDIDAAFSVASRTNTLLKLLNHHYGNHHIDPLEIGIGVDYGQALMIKAGFSGSGINDVVYMGSVVNRAAHLAHEAGRGGRKPIFLGGDFRFNLNEHNKGLLTALSVGGLGKIYAGDFVNTPMNQWIGELR